MKADIYLSLTELGNNSRNTLILFIKKLFKNLVLALFCFTRLLFYTKKVFCIELSSYVVSSSYVALFCTVDIEPLL